METKAMATEKSIIDEATRNRSDAESELQRAINEMPEADKIQYRIIERYLQRASTHMIAAIDNWCHRYRTEEVLSALHRSAEGNPQLQPESESADIESGDDDTTDPDTETPEPNNG